MTDLAESASFLGYVFFAFLVVVYLPHIIFKFLAELSVDLGGRRDITRLEEFVAAALPSVLFNIFTFITYEFAYVFVPRHRGYDVDWAVIASLFADDKGAVADFIYAGHLWPSVGLYLTLLYAIAAVNGGVYGSVVHEALESGRFPTLKHLLDAPLRPSMIKQTVGWLWHIFYQDAMVPYFQWMVQETWVMVRTVDGRLYHGQFVRYEKAVDGSFETIKLREVRRYCYNEIEQRFKRGQIAVSDFGGELHIKWSRIADINRVERNKIFDIMYDQYMELKDRHIAANKEPPPVPPGLILPDEDEDENEDQQEDGPNEDIGT